MTAMTGVLGQPSLCRQDIALALGVTQRFGFRWKRANGSHVDLYGYTGVVRFMSQEGVVWGQVTPTLHEDGLCEIEVPPSFTSANVWKSRGIGQYAVILTAPDDTVTCLASGYLRITNMGVL